ncbi:MAG: nucleotide exchange factor GrpE [Alphaproteobacteria bacterium]|jgi:molecular chaperone GrpE|nr:nucleotide exchange factor GrpE [Alphaproteobacteria bacterium]
MKDKKNTPKEDKTEKTDKKISEAEELQLKIAELNDKYLRAMAELENTRRRATMDAQSAARVRAISIAEKFLPLVDAICVALEQQPNNKDFQSLMLAANGSLESANIKKIETIGQILNPKLHNAIQTEASDKPSGTIISEFQSGYMLGDNILRTAMVIVAK